MTPSGDSLQGNTDSSGFLRFPDVTPGTYRIWVNQAGYVQHMSSIEITSASDTLDVTLSARCYPLTGFYCDPQTLHSVWNPYSNDTTLFFDDFSSENFTAQGWTVSGENWHINSSYGKPTPSAYMGFPPLAGVYDQDITSPWLWGTGAEVMTLSYDWGIDNYAMSGDGFFDVDIDNGTGWQTLRHRNRNFLGGIDWWHDELDISDFRYALFRIRFRMYGDTTKYFEKWQLDNIKIEAKPIIPEIGGYNVFYNWIQIAFLTDTSFTVQPGLTNYGEEFNLCIGLVSDQCNNTYICDSVTSQFLPPPRNVTGTFSYDTVSISWVHPIEVTPQVLRYDVLRGGTTIGQVFPPDTSFRDIVPQPNAWCYTVKAIYNLESLGFPPGSTASSMEAGPVCLNVFYGKELPWTETWTPKKNEINGWDISTGNNPWHLNYQEGYAAPCIAFEPGTPETQYYYSVTSPWLNTAAYECASYNLTFWFKMHSSGPYGNTNRLMLEAWNGIEWSELWSVYDDNEHDWTKVKLTLGNSFSHSSRLRFSAQSEGTTTLTFWYIDSIQLTPVMNPPSSLTASLIGDYIAQISWNPVVCGFQDWAEQKLGWLSPPNDPIPAVPQSTNKAYGKVFTFDNPEELALHSLSFHHSSHGINGSWLYRIHLIDWPSMVPIRVYGPFSTTCNDCAELNIPLGDILIKSHPGTGPASAGLFIEPISLQQGQGFPVLTTMLTGGSDMTASQLSLPGYDIDTTYTARNFLFQLTCLIPSKNQQLTAGLGEDVLSYQIFRDGDSLDTTPMGITSYTDSLAAPGEYCYTVKALHLTSSGQQLSPPTNEECVLVLSVPEISAPRLNVWPNPAGTLLNVSTSGNRIKDIRLTDPAGRTVHMIHNLNDISYKLHLNTVPAGFYFLVVEMEDGQRSTATIVKL
ncbi:MAG: hypothetical protein A2X11_11470 [Bacteroidetes bacterium GWE2_42_24]|nr:MAG: hypothetical protein A2X11_11470 [Bacteroidetes bacterium GWE2_42_24]OFY25528.1 MAG: hypothetical protein A2X09_07070 [Bacteroidetes bacterium GWF2_43_11]